MAESGKTQINPHFVWTEEESARMAAYVDERYKKVEEAFTRIFFDMEEHSGVIPQSRLQQLVEGQFNAIDETLESFASQIRVALRGIP